jgi:hypothetical protein
MVLANGETFSKIRDTLGEELKEEGESYPSVAVLAKRLHVSRTTMNNLLNGEEVSVSTLTNLVMPNLAGRWPKGVWEGFTLMDLIREDESMRLPESPEKFPLKVGDAFGYYLNHDRKSLGSVDWFSEDLAVERVEPGPLPEQFSLFGTLTLKDGVAHDFTLARLDKYTCVMRGTEKKRAGASTRSSFAGLFTHVYEGALVGIWSAVNLTWRPASYRYILSPDPLRKQKLTAISRLAGNEFHSSASP